MSAEPQPAAGAASGPARADAQRGSSAFLRAILECADYAIISTGPDGVIRTFNRAAERMLGYRAEEVIGRVTPEILHDYDEVVRRAAKLAEELGRPVAAGFEAFVAKACEGLTDEQEWTYIRKDGSRFPVQLSVTAMRDEAGQTIGFMGIAQDISSRRSAQARVGQLTAQLDRRVRERTRELQATQQRFGLVSAIAPVGVYHTTADGQCDYLNPRWCELTGMTAPEGLGRGWEQALHPEDRGAVHDEWSRAVREQRVFSMEYRYRRPDGGVRWVFGQAVAELDSAGQVIGYVGTVTDITERKRAEQELRASEGRLKLAQQAARVGTFELDLQTGVNTWSPELEAMHGLPPGGFPGTQPAWENLVHPEDVAQARAQVQRAFDTNESVEGEWRVVWPDGSTHWLIGRFQVFRDVAGQPLRLAGVNLDITQRKRAEQVTATFAELGRQLSAAHSRRAAAGIIMVAADQLLHSDAALLHLLSMDRRRVFRVLTVDTVNGWRSEQPGDYVASEPSLMFRRVIRHGAQLVLRDGAEDGAIPFEPFGDPRRKSASLMFAPLRAGANTLGILSLQSYTPRAYTAEDLALLQSLADQVAGAFERLEAEQETSEAALFPEQNPNPVLRVGGDGRLLYANPASRPLLAVWRSGVGGRPPEALARIVADALASGARTTVDVALGAQAFLFSVAPIREAGYVNLYGHDITERKRAEEALRQARAELEERVQARTAELARLNMVLHSEIEDRKATEAELQNREEQLRDLFENATDLIQSVAPDGRILFVNRAWLNTLGYRMGELAALTIFDIIHPECLGECREHFARVMQGEPLINFQAVFRAKDGRKIHVEGSANARFENGRPVASWGIFRDISKRKAVEAERERLIAELQAALAEVKTLSGLLPVCGWCKKIRDDSGYWNSLEGYLKKSSGMDITHGICPECQAKMMLELDQVSSESAAQPPPSS